MDHPFISANFAPQNFTSPNRRHVRCQDRPLLCCQVKVDQLHALDSSHADDFSPLCSRCPFAHRARIALKMADAPYELSEIDLHSKPKWFLENVNYAGKVHRAVAIQSPVRRCSLTDHCVRFSQVPALTYGTPADSSVEKPPKDVVVLRESSVIVDFVASLYPLIDCEPGIFSSPTPLTRLTPGLYNRHRRASTRPGESGCGAI
jgi:hypothetical protein